MVNTEKIPQKNEIPGREKRDIEIYGSTRSMRCYDGQGWASYFLSIQAE